MQSAYVVTGTLTDERTVTLDEDLDLPAARVRVVIEPLEETPPRPIAEILASILMEQDARGRVARTREEIDTELTRERESWDR